MHFVHQPVIHWTKQANAHRTVGSIVKFEKIAVLERKNTLSVYADHPRLVIL